MGNARGRPFDRRFFAWCLLALAFVAGTSGAQESRSPTSRPTDTESSERFSTAARNAIRSAEGAVLVVEVKSVWVIEKLGGLKQLPVNVMEVIKTSRSDDGLFVVPTLLVDTAEGSESCLQEGRKYVVALRLSPSGGVLVDARELRSDPAEGDLMDDLRRAAGAEAVYGKTSGLRAHFRWDLDFYGVRTRRPDGAVDPTAFGLDAESIDRFVREGSGIYVVWVMGMTWKDRDTWECEVVERLAGPELPRKVKFWKLDHEGAPLGDGKPKPPYVPKNLSATSLHLIFTRGAGPANVLGRVPLIGTNDSCVQCVRQWVRAASSRESRPESRSNAETR